MTMYQRWGLALIIVVVDLMVVFIPVTAFFAAYVILTRPPWFRDWTLSLYHDQQ